MNNKCKVCGIEYEAERITSKYCSEKCKKLAFLNKEVSVPELAFLSVPNATIPATILNSSPKLEGAELDKFLMEHSIEELDELGIWIPNWKRAGYPSKFHLMKEIKDSMVQKKFPFVWQGYSFEN